MRVLVFEFLTCGGVADQHPLDDDQNVFLQQGRSMLTSVCEDLLELEVEVVIPVDTAVEVVLSERVHRINVTRESELDAVLLAAAETVNHILLIGPESDGCLAHFAELLSPWADRFISPDLSFIRLAGDKWNCHQWLSARGVPCPKTVLVNGDAAAELIDFPFPWVTKPIDGCGSENVRLVVSRNELPRLEDAETLVQPFVNGTPVSVAVIINSRLEVHFLDPGRQVFDRDPFGVHVRTEFSLEQNLRYRALALAGKVVDALPETRGYFGIDMILGSSQSEDVVIEINPRLTTSYCDLRRRGDQNLSRKMLPFE